MQTVQHLIISTLLIVLSSCEKDLPIVPDEDYFNEGDQMQMPWGDLPTIKFTGYTIRKVYDEAFLTELPDVYVAIKEVIDIDDTEYISYQEVHHASTYNNILNNVVDSNTPYHLDFDSVFVINNNGYHTSNRIWFSTYEYDNNPALHPADLEEGFFIGFEQMKFAFHNNITSLHLKDNRSFDIELHFVFE